jgi:hypothetical protein
VNTRNPPEGGGSFIRVTAAMMTLQIAEIEKYIAEQTTMA